MADGPCCSQVTKHTVAGEHTSSDVNDLCNETTDNDNKNTVSSLYYSYRVRYVPSFTFIYYMS